MNKVLIVTSNERRYENQMFVGGYTHWDMLNREILPKFQWEQVGEGCWRDQPYNYYTVYETTIA